MECLSWENLAKKGLVRSERHLSGQHFICKNEGPSRLLSLKAETEGTGRYSLLRPDHSFSPNTGQKPPHSTFLKESNLRIGGSKLTCTRKQICVYAEINLRVRADLPARIRKSPPSPGGLRKAGPSHLSANVLVKYYSSQRMINDNPWATLQTES